jgi:Cu2+-exporting ATPase
MNPTVTLPLAGADGVGVQNHLEAAALSLSNAERPQGPLKVTDDFLVLEDPVEQKEFTRFTVTDGKRTAESVLMVQGMYCAACADTVEGVVCQLPGVLSAEVHAATRRLTLQWDPEQIQASRIAQAVGATGYRLLPMHEALSISHRLAEGRKVLWRMFVAGICMMQVMMYALPAYITQPGDIPPDIQQLLRWASWVLSLPVILFASGSFFANAWRDLKMGRVGMDTPVSIGIVVTFVVSSLATFDSTGPWGHEVWFDSLTMFVFFLMGGRYFEFRARDRTAGALDDLMNRLPEVCERQKADRRFESVSVRRLEVGDVVRIHAGQAFPGDGVLLSARATVDEALLTGESHPVSRLTGDLVIAGSFNLAGPADVRVDKLGADTRFSQIVALMEKASTEKPRLAILADRIAAPFLMLVLVSAGLAGWYWWHIDPARALAVAVAVLIVTCPCALSLATPAAMLASAGALARRGVLVRRLQAFESLASVDTVIFDKTGTLTHDKVVLSAVQSRAGLSGTEALAVAGTLSAGSLHPASRAITEAAKNGWSLSGVWQSPADVDFVPLPLIDLVEHAGQGMLAHWTGRGDVRLGSASFCGVDESAATVINSPRVHLSDAQGWMATFVLDEGLRPDAAQAVAALKAVGITTWLLSGDRPEAAMRIGEAVGVDHVVAGASPEDKLQELVGLQAKGHRVAMVGDGLNDGPVLARANTSFALGTAAPLAQAQSDYVIQGGAVIEVVNALVQARSTMRVVRQNLVWAAGYNTVSVPLALMGYMPPWLAGLGMAVSSFWVIGNALRLNRSKAAANPQTDLPVLH